MMVRIAAAAVGIPLFIGLCFWGAAQFATVIFVLAAMGLAEMLRGFRRAGHHPNVPIALIGLLGPLLIWGADYGFGAMQLASSGGKLLVIGFIGLVWELWKVLRAEKSQIGANLAQGLLCAAYISLFSGMAWLRDDPFAVNAGHFPNMSRGIACLLLTVFCVWTTDSAAYFCGRAFGKLKLAPTISPNKTVEGALGGLVFAALCGAGLGILLVGNMGRGLAVGLIAGLFGQMGDLFESALKRELGIKDFGGIMPGHGGVLDRFDSLLFVAPLALLVLR